FTPGAAGGFSANAGALSSYGIGGVTARAPGSSPGPRLVLTFDYVKVTTASGIQFNTGFVEVRPAPCGEPAAFDPTSAPPWAGVSVLSSNQPATVPCTVPVTCTIGPYHPTLDGVFLVPPGSPDGAKIRFRFDTGWNVDTGVCGWSVDNVLLTNEECSPSCSGPVVVAPRIASVGGESTSPNPAFGISLSNALPGILAILNIGVANVPATPIPFPPGCLLCCSPFLLLPAVAVPPSGALVLPLPIPAGIPACTSEVCVQWYLLAPPLVMTSSAGKIRIQIG
ncbi:MAG: hypothetical protein ACREIU_12345, partial [Planctomycetota bacterium]